MLGNCDWLGFLVSILTVVCSAILSGVIAFVVTKMQLKHQLANSERARRFEFEKLVTLKSLDHMEKATHLLQELLYTVFRTNEGRVIKEEELGKVEAARVYISLHVVFLANAVRPALKRASDELAAIVRAKGQAPANLPDAIKKAKAAIEQAHDRLSKFIDEHNLLN